MSEHVKVILLVLVRSGLCGVKHVWSASETLFVRLHWWRCLKAPPTSQSSAVFIDDAVSKLRAHVSQSPPTCQSTDV